MAKIKAQGSVFKIGSDTVGQVKSISGPSISCADVDVTSLSSTLKEYAPGIPDGGDVSLEVWMDLTDAGQDAIFTDANTPNASQTFSIDLSNGDQFSWSGYVKKFETSGYEVDGYVTASVDIKVNGTVTFTPAP